MFIHNFKYSIKTLFRNKSLIFWTFAFPLILGTLFFMAFSNIEKSEKLSVIDIAVINNNEFNNTVYKETLENLSKDKNLFNIKYVDENQAKELLEKEKIVGYLEIKNNEPLITVTKNGIDETIFKYTIDEIFETNNLIENIAIESTKSKVPVDYNKLINDINSERANLKNISNDNLSYTMIEFYTLIAMTCLYGGILGSVSLNKSLANMTNQGKRVSISPTKKSTIILSSVLASYIIQLIGLFLLFMYTIFVLKVDYGNNIGLVILLSLVGSFAGLSQGILISSIVKSNDNTKTGIIIAVTMLGCFLSGMMGITMKYIVDTNVPILNKINLSSMITDGLYSLYYYDTLDRYLFNITSLVIFSIIMILITFIILRRQRYDSI